MKKTIALIGVAALLATVLMPSTVSAQSTPVAQTPATIATTVTTNLASGNVMDVRRQRHLPINRHQSPMKSRPKPPRKAPGKKDCSKKSAIC